MDDNFKIDIPFETKPPRLKDLVNNHVMGDVQWNWLRSPNLGYVKTLLKTANQQALTAENHYI